MSNYTDEILAVVCPTCQAVGKCLEKVRDGNKYLSEPHESRVTEAITQQQLDRSA